MATQVMTFTRTTVGKKVLMAVTGLFMFGFLIAHMLGNLQAWGVFGGEKALVKYAVWLRSMPSLLWAARLVLLGCLAVHTWAAIELLLRNLKSRQALSNRYHRPAPPQAAIRPESEKRTREIMELDAKIPEGPIEKKWDRHRFEMKLVNPANKRKYNVIVVGSGLAGASAAASLGELGYKVKCFCFQDSPRRAHSIAAQGGINAAKNYQNDGDSIYRLFYDTVKGGDFRAREANVYRLAEVSVRHHRPVRGPGRALRPRVRRPAGQPLLRRRAGLAHLLRPRPDRPAAAARRLPALSRQIGLGKVEMFSRREMLDLVLVDGRPAASSPATWSPARSSATPPTRSARHRRLRQRLLPLDQRHGCNVTAAWRAHKRGAAFANPCFTQIHPTCIPQPATISPSSR
jgi:hypothetical protein